MSEKLNARELAINYLQYVSANSGKVLNEAEYLRKLIETENTFQKYLDEGLPDPLEVWSKL
ncbi:hypothetical protein BTJ39_21360 [Izhakiella australiensis]|jgi:hypothetical protein|uniref:Uncharacterized protein n=1 Tax=Izhakiella australiensis TaxID=1926881 RepID=A0A1S8YBK2_9GAMM|nr:hypothetical protein [Izhakiella australiensis]OON36521.1 hypothetical protein BTJ39_21360 [Izhakiella australiensis]